jgi:hypothetical protein
MPEGPPETPLSGRESSRRRHHFVGAFLPKDADKGVLVREIFDFGSCTEPSPVRKPKMRRRPILVFGLIYVPNLEAFDNLPLQTALVDAR